MPHSHHSHSGLFCRHAAQGTTLEDAVQEAIQRGFKTFGLSEHCPRYRQQDLYPEESDLTPTLLQSTFLSYLTEAHRLKRLYASQIDLLVGLETDYITIIDLEGLEALLDEHGDRIEYVMGGMHHVGEIPIDFDKMTWEKAVTAVEKTSMAMATSKDEVMDTVGQSSAVTSFFIAYFDAQYTLLTRIQPTIVAHIDLCRLYVPSIRLDDDATYPGVWERLERNIKTVVEYGGLFEVSSAPFRKGWETGYPGEEVLQLIMRLGGKLCLSDDSHGPAYVGLNYTRLKAYLMKQNVKEIWYLVTSSSSAITSSSSSANTTAKMEGKTDETSQNRSKKWKSTLELRRMDGEWWTDPFWDKVGR